MNLESHSIEELIELRAQSRKNKDWSISDSIRNYLDEKLVFSFDQKDFQDVYS